MTTQLQHSSGPSSMNCLSSGLIGGCGTRPSTGLCQPTPEPVVVPTSNYDLSNSFPSSIWPKTETPETSFLFTTGSSKTWCAPVSRNLTHGPTDSSQKSLYYPGNSPTTFDISSPQDARADTGLVKAMEAYPRPTLLSDSTIGPMIVPNQVETDMAKLLDDTDSPSDFTLQNQSDPDSVDAGCYSETGPAVNTHLLERTNMESSNEQPYTMPIRTPYLNQLFCAKALFCEPIQGDQMNYGPYDQNVPLKTIASKWDGIEYNSASMSHDPQSTVVEEPHGLKRSPLYSSGNTGVRLNHCQSMVESLHASKPTEDGRQSPFLGFSKSSGSVDAGAKMMDTSPEIAAYVAAAVAAASVSHHSRTENSTAAPCVTTATIMSTAITTTTTTTHPSITNAHLNYSHSGPPTHPIAPLPSTHPALVNTYVAHKQPCSRLNPYDVKSFADSHSSSTAGNPFPFQVPSPYHLPGGVHPHSISLPPPLPPPPHQMHNSSANYTPYAPLRHFGPHPGQPGYGFGLDGTRRKNATRESTTTLKVWLQEHIKNPYPSKGEKIMLAIITKMTLTQVSTWFANARRRLKKENKMSWHQKTNNSNSGAGRSSPADPSQQQKHSISTISNTEVAEKLSDQSTLSKSQDGLPDRVRLDEHEEGDEDGYEDNDISCTDDEEDEDGDEEIMEEGYLDGLDGNNRQRYMNMKSPVTKEHSFEYQSSRSHYTEQRVTDPNTDDRRELQPRSISYLRNVNVSSPHADSSIPLESSYVDGSTVKRFPSHYSNPFPSRPMIDLMRSIPSNPPSSFQFRDPHLISGHQLFTNTPLTDSLMQRHASYIPTNPVGLCGLPRSGSTEVTIATESRTPVIFEQHNQFGTPPHGYNCNTGGMMPPSYDSNSLVAINFMSNRSNIPLSSELPSERSSYESSNTSSFLIGSDGTRAHTNKLR